MHDTKYRNRLNLNQTIEQFTSILFHMKNGYGSEEIRVSRLASHFLKNLNVWKGLFPNESN